MKKNWLVSLLLTLFASSIFIACEDGYVPEDPVDVFQRIASGEISATYTSTGVKLFNKNSETGNQWKEIDLSELAGWQSSLPYDIHIKDGSCWLRYNLFPLSGPNPLYEPWEAYCKKKGISSDLYISYPITLSEDGKTFKIGHHEYTIDHGNSSGISFSSYWEHSVYPDLLPDGNYETGYSREAHTYTAGKLTLPDLSTILWYESEKEMFTDLLRRIRDEFGDKFYLSEITDDYSEAIANGYNPLYDLDFIEILLLRPWELYEN